MGMELKVSDGPAVIPPWASLAVAAALLSHWALIALSSWYASAPGQLVWRSCATLAAGAAWLNVSYALGFGGAATGMGRALVVLGASDAFVTQWAATTTGRTDARAGFFPPVALLVQLAAQVRAASGGCSTALLPVPLHAGSPPPPPPPLLQAVAALADCNALRSRWSLGTLASALESLSHPLAAVLPLPAKASAPAVGVALRSFIAALLPPAAASSLWATALPANEIVVWVLAALFVLRVLGTAASAVVWHPHVSGAQSAAAIAASAHSCASSAPSRTVSRPSHSLQPARRGFRAGALLRLVPAAALAAAVLACGLHPDVLHVGLGLGRSALEFGPSGYRLALGRSLWGVPLLLAFVAAQALLTAATLLRGAARLPVPATLQVGLPLALVVPVAMDFVGGMPEASDLLGFVAGGCATLYVAWAVSAAAQVAGLSWLPAPAAAAVAAKEGAELPRAHALELIARASEAISADPTSAATSQMPAAGAPVVEAEADAVQNRWRQVLSDEAEEGAGGVALVEPDDYQHKHKQHEVVPGSSSYSEELETAAAGTVHRSEEAPLAMSRRRASPRASVIAAAAASNAPSPSRRRSPSARRRS